MKVEVCIIGAGPSGLCAAKSLSEVGIDDFILLEARDQIGGIWGVKDGYAWPNMRTNLSKYSCMFSDFPWPTETEIFPKKEDVFKYLCSYSEKYIKTEKILFKHNVFSIKRENGIWIISCDNFGKDVTIQANKVLIATGIFNKSKFPPFKNISAFKGSIIHSVDFRSPDQIKGNSVTIVGSAFSANEIATAAAVNGLEVSQVIQNPQFILNRFVGDKKEPIDFFFYKYRNMFDSDLGNITERNIAKGKFIESVFGNPGTFCDILNVDYTNGKEVFSSIAEGYLQAVGEGKINLIQGTFVDFYDKGIIVKNEHGFKKLECKNVIFATGIMCDLEFLDETEKSILEYNPNDLLMPIISFFGNFSPHIDDFAMVGMYRGPYFSIIEMQSRIVASVFAGNKINLSSQDIVEECVKAREIRNKRDRAQFPYGNYSKLSYKLGSILGVLPNVDEFDDDLRNAIINGALIPSIFRLVGPNSNFEIASKIILEAYDAFYKELG